MYTDYYLLNGTTKTLLELQCFPVENCTALVLERKDFTKATPSSYSSKSTKYVYCTVGKWYLCTFI